MSRRSALFVGSAFAPDTPQLEIDLATRQLAALAARLCDESLTQEQFLLAIRQWRAESPADSSLAHATISDLFTRAADELFRPTLAVPQAGFLLVVGGESLPVFIADRLSAIAREAVPALFGTEGAGGQCDRPVVRPGGPKVSRPVSRDLMSPYLQRSFAGEPTVFSQRFGNAIVITTDDSVKVEMTLSARGGTFCLPTTRGLLIQVGQPDAECIFLQFRGRAGAANRAMDGLRFTPKPTAGGTAQLRLGLRILVGSKDIVCRSTSSLIKFSTPSRLLLTH